MQCNALLTLITTSALSSELCLKRKDVFVAMWPAASGSKISGMILCSLLSHLGVSSMGYLTMSSTRCRTDQVHSFTTLEPRQCYLHTCAGPGCSRQSKRLVSSFARPIPLSRKPSTNVSRVVPVSHTSTSLGSNRAAFPQRYRAAACRRLSSLPHSTSFGVSLRRKHHPKNDSARFSHHRCSYPPW